MIPSPKKWKNNSYVLTVFFLDIFTNKIRQTTFYYFFNTENESI